MLEVRDRLNFEDYLDSLLNSVESDDLEFKSAAGGFPGSFWDTYSAFANSEGGVIVLGVIERKGKFYIDNLSDEQIEKYTKDFWNNVNNRATVSCNLLKTEDVVVEDYNGHKLMLFFIPRASREQRPVYRTSQPYNGTFKRNHEGDYKCTEREVQRMFSDANVSNPADSRILRNYSLDDLDMESVAQYRQLFKLAKPDHPWSVLSDFEFLKKIGAYRTDRGTKEEGFTVAGVLMFGKEDAITDNECCPDFFPDYQEKLSDNPEIRWTNRICPDGTWEANLFQFYLRVLPRLSAVLPKPFILEGNIRRDETPAHVAVREALVNLCIHTDYSENATMVVRLYSNKIVFTNPGTLLVSKMQYYGESASVCRNKTLQKMFMLIGSAEKAGSGVDKILAGWRFANWRAPMLRTLSQPDLVELTMMMDEGTKDRLVRIFGTEVFSLGHERLLTLNAACTDGYITNENLRVVLNQHKAEVADLLKDMCKHKLLVQEGYGRGTKYRLPMTGNIASSEPNIASSEPNIASSEPNIASSGANIASSGANIASSGANIASSEPNIASTRVKQRMPYQSLKAMICTVCSEWISLDELSAIVRRDKIYLRNFIIPKMLEDNSLEMLFPGVPNHPRQKYKSTVNK
ncbi:AAA family ATPase [Segatella copri]|uniref:AAA family ATPase n=1 Tax=Segatella copri TaxID=165179 RepID=A0AA93B945_9BACT|nr:RNA-binding domain-containing protein [Segatella copri]RGL61371.1 AAA family ATPase [Segatella copri]